MSRKRTCKSVIHTTLLLLSLTGATDAMALLITSSTLNGNEVVAAPAGPNELVFTARFHNLQSVQFDVLIESGDDPFSPIALTGLLENLTVEPWSGLELSLGGGATLTAIGDVTPSSLVTAFPRGTVADFAFDPLFAVNTSGAIGGAIPWLVNTHGARLFSITLSPSAPPVAAGVPEPATVALVLIAFAGLFTARRYRKPAPARDAR